MSFFAFNKRRRLGRRGVTALEFAFCGPIFIMMMVGAMDLARFWFTTQSLRNAVAEASRKAMVDDTLTGCNPTKLASSRPGLRDTLDLCITRGTVSGMSQLVVTGSTDFRFAMPYFGSRNRSLREVTELRF
ncbi:TadE family protein [Sabulicella rubraurantiaca]|uniref:TadE family protein n=1 Tax=Sabulicella rubraurantiaca TaxID=2811429 RepID=UPI001A96FFA8|nr:TadE/TadG family type IV pilus assembly protein [Sabulicella rubraurantiaca]